MFISSKNTFIRTSRKMFDQISDYDILGKLTHKTNYHSPTREGHFEKNCDFWWKNISGL